MTFLFNRTMAVLAVVLLISSCGKPEQPPQQSSETSSIQADTVKPETLLPVGNVSPAEIIAHIHTLYNKRDFESLYNMATESMRQRIGKTQFSDFLEFVRSTLGEVSTYEITNQDGEVNDDLIILSLKVEYENDTGTEKWALDFRGEYIQWSEFKFDAPALYK